MQNVWISEKNIKSNVTCDKYNILYFSRFIQFKEIRFIESIKWFSVNRDISVLWHSWPGNTFPDLFYFHVCQMAIPIADQ